ncbi:phage regulatory protein/antirepressor Ant [Lacrimispora indolis]|uniref:phage regulatory protein/antirepressor Ant n=1 Tax=Lacrimispora indolis TaxID=69825 RepID=UPI000425376A|nr:phage regulatory protein/antirepressor Ant [[Clostridium] methoxybenzovorans]
MNELINVSSDSNKTISTLEIAEMMELSHAKLIRKLEGDSTHIGIIPILTKAQLGSSEYFIESVYKDGSGKENKCYEVTRLGCDFLANKFTGEKGILFTAKYVKRFAEMEKIILSSEQLKSKLLLSIYDGGQSAVLASKQLSELEVKEATAPLIAENKELKPKAAFHDAIQVSETCISFGEFSATLQNNKELKSIKLGRNTVMEWCRNQGYLCESYSLKNKPSQRMLSSGYMEYKENVTERNGKEHITYKPLLSGKGQIWLTKKLIEYYGEAA